MVAWLDKGGGVDAAERDGTTLLTTATCGGHEAMVRMLLQPGARVNQRARAMQIQTAKYNLSEALQALQAMRATLGDRDPRTLTAIGNMGLLLMAMGQLKEARPLLEEDLQASRETLGDRHPDTLISVGNLALLLQEMGQLEEARPLCEEALRGERETLGDAVDESHP